MEKVVFLLIGLVTMLLASCSESDSIRRSPDPINAPDGLIAQPNQDHVILAWNDQSNNETGFEVERSVNNSAFSSLAELPANSTSYTDNDVTTNTMYTYRIRATREAAPSDYSKAVAYASHALAPREDSITFSASALSVDDTTSAVGFSREIFADATLSASVSTSNTDYTLPEELAPFAPTVTLSIPKGDIDLAGNNSEVGAEILVLPSDEHREAPAGAHPFAVVNIETAAGMPRAFRIPYDPGYPLELGTSHLGLVASEEGLTDPIRIRVSLVYENSNSEAVRLTPHVINQDFGLFGLPETFDYESDRERCEERRAFWTDQNITEEQNLDGKTPLVLIHGWQTLGNATTVSNLYRSDIEFTPHICDWLNFLRVYRTEEELHEAYELFTFSYDSDERVEGNARELSETLERAFPGESAVVIAHSMGGLVASMAKREFESGVIGNIISLGTLYRGSAAITCKRVENGRCAAAMISPRVKHELAELTLTTGMYAVPLMQNVLGHPGTQDLAFEWGLGEHHKCSLFTPEDDQIAGGISFGCEKIPNTANPFFAALNETPPSPDTHFAIAGEINQGSRDLDSGPGRMARMYDIVGLSMLNAHGYRSDGIVPIRSAIFDSLDTSNSAPALDHSVYPRSHHSALNGRDPSDPLDDPLPEIVERLRARAGIETTAPTALVSTLDPATLYQVELDPSGSDTFIASITSAEGDPNISDIAECPDGSLYGTSFTALYKIDPATGQATLIGNTDPYERVNSLVCDVNNTLLAGHSDIVHGGRLLELDRETGAATLIGNTRNGGFSGDMAFAPDGTLFAVLTRFFSDYLMAIDPETGRAGVYGEIGFDEVFGLAFRGEQLYGFTSDSPSDDGTLITIETDPSAENAGQGQLVRPLTFPVSGATYKIPQDNEPE